MTRYELIFSEKAAARTGRHLLFWLVVYVFVVISYFHDFLDVLGFWKWILLEMLECIGQVFVQVVLCYCMMYLLLPYFLKHRNRLIAGTLLVLLFAVCWAVHYCTHYFVFKTIHFSFGLPFRTTPLIYWFSLISLLTYLPVSLGLFIAIKSFKTWYLKQLNQKELIRSNTDAELQLLKAQVHPHFLFNTLNNIYSFLLDRSPLAQKLILQLSGMLKYMIYDCSASTVPLHKEIKLINDYVGLEMVRYGNQLQLDMVISETDSNRHIAPLLMIPFIENTFKHGASRVLRDPWI
jgi:sensor histidine kinase YesM